MWAPATEHLPNSYVSRTTPEPQQGSSWRPPEGVLGQLIRAARQRAAALAAQRSALERRAATAPVRPRFTTALSRAEVAVIAEIKRASPSRGEIRADLDAAAQARAYAQGGAAAISVLTEQSRFGGSLEDLESASSTVAIPLLRKDFIVSEEQILESAGWGASAVLLIVRALDPSQLKRLHAFARELELEALVEVHSADDLRVALECGATSVGINARDLETLDVDREPAFALLAQVPPDVVCVAESGMSSRADVERAANAGAHAVLVGSALSQADDPENAVRLLTGVPRKMRGAAR